MFQPAIQIVVHVSACFPLINDQLSIIAAAELAIPQVQLLGE
jgi:hypothetical protein